MRYNYALTLITSPIKLAVQLIAGMNENSQAGPGGAALAGRGALRADASCDGRTRRHRFEGVRSRWRCGPAQPYTPFLILTVHVGRDKDRITYTCISEHFRSIKLVLDLYPQTPRSSENGGDDVVEVGAGDVTRAAPSRCATSTKKHH